MQWWTQLRYLMAAYFGLQALTQVCASLCCLNTRNSQPMLETVTHCYAPACMRRG
jgi:hypothetical protein